MLTEEELARIKALIGAPPASDLERQAAEELCAQIHADAKRHTEEMIAFYKDNPDAAEIQKRECPEWWAKHIG